MYLIVAACSGDGSSLADRLTGDAGTPVDGMAATSSNTGSGNPPRADGMAGPTEGGATAMESGARPREAGPAGPTEGGPALAEGGLLDRFIRPVPDANAQDCATCTSGALRVLTADTDINQWTTGTLQFAQMPAPDTGTDAVTRLVAEGPLFVTSAPGAAGVDYYVVKTGETCALDPSAASDDTEINFNSLSPDANTGAHHRGVGDLDGNSPSPKLLLMPNEKLCAKRTIRFAVAGSLPAYTIHWQGFRPYTG